MAITLPRSCGGEDIWSVVFARVRAPTIVPPMTASSRNATQKLWARDKRINANENSIALVRINRPRCSAVLLAAISSAAVTAPKPAPHQEPQAGGPYPYHVSGNGWHQDDKWQAKQTEERGYGEEYENEAVPVNVTNSFDHRIQKARVLVFLQRRDADHQKADDESKEAGRIQIEACGGAERAKSQSCDGWANRARHVELSRVESDPIHQVVPGNKIRNDGLIRRVIQRRRYAGKKTDHKDFGDGNPADRSEDSQQQGQEHHGCLRDQHELAAIEAIGDRSARQSEKKRRNLCQKRVQPQQEWRVGNQENDPTQRNILHPSPDI